MPTLTQPPIDTPPLGDTLTALAPLLEYPGPDFEARSAAAPGEGAAALRTLDPEGREELYTATFDVTPSCVPYVSIHLFGEENFKRGAFMAALHARYAETGFDPAGELPDHLAVLLRFAAGAGETERRELLQFCLLSPLARMIESLRPGHPYRTVLQDIEGALRSAYPDVVAAPSPREEMMQHGNGCHGCGTRHEQNTEQAPGA